MIPFAKAHACGNDFLIVAEEAAQGRDRAELTRRLCARNTGIGADGIEFFTWNGPKSGSIRLHNADGSIAEISGNGTRCVAAWMTFERGFHPGDELHIETDAGLRVCRVNALKTNGEFTVEVTSGMGVPSFAPRTVTLSNGLVGRFAVNGVEVSTGNPHFVVTVEDADFAVAGLSWQEIGAEICGHSDIPNQTNVEFLRIVSPTEIEIRIFERGVGPTSSSGTG
ncbi:MAG TPA: diaminopimelate epimerase, partial [Terracidiphilus sp.]|nr:diaminopimelate epimerase [Terracidiphilus sp.]